jgi:hypothetical protein
MRDDPNGWRDDAASRLDGVTKGQYPAKRGITKNFWKTTVGNNSMPESKRY